MLIGKNGNIFGKRVAVHVMGHAGVHDEYPMIAGIPGFVADPGAPAIAARDQSVPVDMAEIVLPCRVQIGLGEAQLRRLLEWRERRERLRRMRRFATWTGFGCVAFLLLARVEQQGQSARPAGTEWIHGVFSIVGMSDSIVSRMRSPANANRECMARCAKPAERS
ncbi:hypothetical protein A8H31_05015 [Burkholderia thailandensis]|nr:hypothetical protein A8H31_05015 [Burkholderia thailandensis]